MIEKIQRWFFPVFVVGILLTSAVIFALMFWPISVLKDWSLTVPSGTYNLNEAVNVTAVSTKTRALAPLAHRNIECKNPQGQYISYHLTDVQGVNNNVGHHVSQIPFKIPSIIPSLPTTCRFSIDVEYQVYPFRTINQYVASNTFELK